MYNTNVPISLNFTFQKVEFQIKTANSVHQSPIVPASLIKGKQMLTTLNICLYYTQILLDFASLVTLEVYAENVFKIYSMLLGAGGEDEARTNILSLSLYTPWLTVFVFLALLRLRFRQ